MSEISTDNYLQLLPIRQIEIFEGCKRSSLGDDLALGHEAEQQTMHVEYMASALTAWNRQALP